MQHQMAQAYTEISAARALVYNAARKKEAGEDFVRDAAMAKLYSSQVAGRVSGCAIEWMGGMGFVREGIAERCFVIAKSELSTKEPVTFNCRLSPNCCRRSIKDDDNTLILAHMMPKICNSDGPLLNSSQSIISADTWTVLAGWRSNHEPATEQRR